MRVLHLTVEYPPVIHGGLGTAVGGLVEASAQANLDVIVLLVHDADGAGYAAASTAQTAPCFRDQTGPRVLVTAWADAYASATRLIRGWRPDVLHLHVFWLWPLVAALRRETGVPVVYTVHSLDRAEYEVGHGPPECLTQWEVQCATIEGADRVIALTRSEQGMLKAYCPAAEQKVRVVGNGLAIPADTQPPRRNDNEPLILFTGRFVDRKGVRELLGAVPHVLAVCPDAQFVLAGGQRGCTVEEMDLWWRPEQLRGCTHLKFTGWLDTKQMAGWYESADVLVVPSWYEPFGMVVLEGMLHGLAIAAANVGGPAEILTHDETALLFCPRDVPALVDTLVQLVNSPSLRRRLGQASRRELRRSWAWPRIVKQVHSVYAEVAPAVN